ncbi:MAG: hypothetical protein QM753_19725 [Thermomicrobiales bacterium]
MPIIRTLFTVFIGAVASLMMLVVLGFFLTGVLFGQAWALLVAFIVMMPTLLPAAILFVLLRTRPQPLGASVKVKGTGTIRRTREWVKQTLPAREPARAAILGVLDEAAQLKHLMARMDSAQFRQADASIGAMPAEFSKKVDEAVTAAANLAERCRILYPTGERRPLDMRTREALDRQVAQMQHLQQALAYSRSTLEIIAINHTAALSDTTRLVRSLNNLTDAIGEVQGVPKLTTDVTPMTPAERTPEALSYLRTVA